MKGKILILAAAALGLTSCADLGLGIEADSGYTGPYYTPGPYYDNWYGPYFGSGFPYGYQPEWPRPYPPQGFNPGPVIVPKPPQQSQPPHNPGYIPSGSPLIPGAGTGTRPGNGGLPSVNPGNVSGRPTLNIGSSAPVEIPSNSVPARGRGR